jgi:hypothetical protein
VNASEIYNWEELGRTAQTRPQHILYGNGIIASPSINTHLYRPSSHLRPRPPFSLLFFGTAPDPPPPPPIPNTPPPPPPKIFGRTGTCRKPLLRGEGGWRRSRARASVYTAPPPPGVTADRSLVNSTIPPFMYCPQCFSRLSSA